MRKHRVLLRCDDTRTKLGLPVRCRAGQKEKPKMPGTIPDHPSTARPSTSRSVAPAKGFDLSNFPIVAIGASAGGLEACQKLLDALPTKPDMSFLLVQHLDPSHKSLMAELLGRH